MNTETLIACHECDLLHREETVPEGGVARCQRCGGVLYRGKPQGIEKTLALTSAALVLFVLANTFPFLGLDVQGQIIQMNLATGVRMLYAEGMPILAGLVLITTILAPLAQLLSLIYVLLPLHLGLAPLPGAATIFRWQGELRHWAMMEIFMLGILVSVVKLLGLASIVPGVALWSFAGLIVVLAAASSALEPHEVWRRLRSQP